MAGLVHLDVCWLSRVHRAGGGASYDTTHDFQLPTGWLDWLVQPAVTALPPAMPPLQPPRNRLEEGCAVAGFSTAPGGLGVRIANDPT